MSDKTELRNITPAVLVALVRDREEFRSGQLVGFGGVSKATGELSRGLAKTYRKSKAEFTVAVGETPVAWISGSTWTLPDVVYSPVTERWHALVRQAAGLE